MACVARSAATVPALLAGRGAARHRAVAGLLQGGGTLLRRTVSTFTTPERRELGERAAHGGGAAPGMLVVEAAIDPLRAQRVLPILHTLLASRPAEESIHDE